MTACRFIVVAALLTATWPDIVIAADPKLPAEKDPGGVPVALIGGGVDYTRPDIAKRLARDGEGNIVGWDLVDNDIHPFSADPVANREADQLLRNSGVELVPMRVPPGASDAVANAAAFLSRTNVRTVVVLRSSQRREDWELFAKAAQHLKSLLFLVPYRDPYDSQSPAKSQPTFPAALNLPNVLSIAAAGDVEAEADVAFAADDVTAAASMLAAALATCHAETLSDGDGAARKTAAIAKLARPRSASKVPAIEPCP